MKKTKLSIFPNAVSRDLAFNAAVKEFNERPEIEKVYICQQDKLISITFDSGEEQTLTFQHISLNYNFHTIAGTLADEVQMVGILKSFEAMQREIKLIALKTQAFREREKEDFTVEG